MNSSLFDRHGSSQYCQHLLVYLALILLPAISPASDKESIEQQHANTLRWEKITLIEPKWKLVINGPKITDDSVNNSQRNVLLFQIDSDPNERKDVSGQHPDVVKRMITKLKKFRALQPSNAVPAYNKRDPNFKAPKEWRIADK